MTTLLRCFMCNYKVVIGWKVRKQASLLYVKLHGNWVYVHFCGLPLDSHLSWQTITISLFTLFSNSQILSYSEISVKNMSKISASFYFKILWDFLFSSFFAQLSLIGGHFAPNVSLHFNDYRWSILRNSWLSMTRSTDEQINLHRTGEQ